MAHLYVNYDLSAIKRDARYTGDNEDLTGNILK